MFNVIDQLEHTNSRNTKIAILQQADNIFKNLLLQTYHPHRHYGIKKGLKNATGNGKNALRVCWPDVMQLLDELASGQLSGNAAKERVFNFIDGLSHFDAELFKRVLTKDLRVGISAKTINKAFGEEFIPEFGVMLASGFSGTITGQVYMSLKLDGLRGVYKEGQMYSRNGKKIHGVNHIIATLVDANIHQVDGELIIPGKHFNEVSGQLRSHEECLDAEYHIFDTMAEGIHFKQRYEHLLSMELRNSNCIKVMKHVLTGDQEKIDYTYARAIDKGYEGLVLKDPGHMYKPGTRSKGWMKIKSVKSEDLPIVGMFEGQGKYEGQAGGFLVERPNGVIVKVGSGFSDDLRVRVWDKPEEYTGKTAEVLYHEETPDGSLRHPRLKCIRFDK